MQIENSQRTEITQAPAGVSKSAKTQQRIAEVMVTLLINFPRAFSFAEPKPLKVGIFRDICARTREHNLIPPAGPIRRSRLISFALAKYVRRGAYLRALQEGSPRFDLDGNIAGKVSAKHAARAAELRKKK